MTEKKQYIFSWLILAFFMWQFVSTYNVFFSSEDAEESAIELVEDMEDEEESEQTEVREGSINQLVEELTEESKLFSEIILNITKRQNLRGTKQHLLFSQLHKQEFFSPPELIG